MAEIGGPILHVIVVGFHHKKGCQVSNKKKKEFYLIIKMIEEKMHQFTI